MTFVPLAGGFDLSVLTQFVTKIGTYVIVVNDVVNAGKRIVRVAASSFRKIRKIWEGLSSSLRATVYVYGGVVELASQWQGVVWHKNPEFNGQ